MSPHTSQGHELTESELKQIEETVREDRSPGAKSLRDLIDQVRGLRVLVRRARQEKVEGSDQ
jgi:hypothetical protein